MRLSGVHRTFLHGGANQGAYVSTYVSNAVGNGSVVAPSSARHASITLYGAGGNGGQAGDVANGIGTIYTGGGGGEGAYSTKYMPVIGGATYYYHLAGPGGSSYWDNSVIFGANSGSNGANVGVSPGGIGGTPFGSYDSGASGQTGQDGQYDSAYGGAGAAVGVNGGAGGSYYSGNNNGGNAVALRGGGGGSTDYPYIPGSLGKAGIGWPSTISIIWYS